MRDPGIDDIEPLFVRREGEPVRLVEAVAHDGRLAGLGLQPIDPRRLLGGCRVALVIAEDAVARIGEPDAVVRCDHDVVGRVELLAVVAVDQHGDGAVVLGARHAPRIVLAAQQTPLAVAGIAVGVVRGLAEHAHMAVFLVPAHHAVVWNVAPDQAAIVVNVDRSFRPSESSSDPLDRGVADLVLEAFVEDLDAGIGIAPVRQIPERQGIGFGRCRDRGRGGCGAR